LAKEQYEGTQSVLVASGFEQLTDWIV